MVLITWEDGKYFYSLFMGLATISSKIGYNFIPVLFRVILKKLFLFSYRY